MSTAGRDLEKAVDLKINNFYNADMPEAIEGLQPILGELSAAARKRGLTDSAWARLAQLPKESLSRLRRRRDCDWATLERLATAIGLRLAVVQPADADLARDGHVPLALTREHEERLYRLIRSGDTTPSTWRAQGPAFFMAGLAVLLASAGNHDRRKLLQLAEVLHPGISEPAVANIWMQRTPIEPSRFFAQLESGDGHAA
jgi:DNA-binding phage protein